MGFFDHRLVEEAKSMNLLLDQRNANPVFDHVTAWMGWLLYLNANGIEFVGKSIFDYLPVCIDQCKQYEITVENPFEDFHRLIHARGKVGVLIKGSKANIKPVKQAIQKVKDRSEDAEGVKTTWKQQRIVKDQNKKDIAAEEEKLAFEVKMLLEGQGKLAEDQAELDNLLFKISQQSNSIFRRLGLTIKWTETLLRKLAEQGQAEVTDDGLIVLRPLANIDNYVQYKASRMAAIQPLPHIMKRMICAEMVKHKLLPAHRLSCDLSLLGDGIFNYPAEIEHLTRSGKGTTVYVELLLAPGIYTELVEKHPESIRKASSQVNARCELEKTNLDLDGSGQCQELAMQLRFQLSMWPLIGKPLAYIAENLFVDGNDGEVFVPSVGSAQAYVAPVIGSILASESAIKSEGLKEKKCKFSGKVGLLLVDGAKQEGFNTFPSRETAEKLAGGMFYQGREAPPVKIKQELVALNPQDAVARLRAKAGSHYIFGLKSGRQFSSEVGQQVVMLLLLAEQISGVEKVMLMQNHHFIEMGKLYRKFWELTVTVASVERGLEDDSGEVVQEVVKLGGI